MGGLTHDEYLDEPAVTVEAMTRIHGMVLKAQNERS